MRRGRLSDVPLLIAVLGREHGEYFAERLRVQQRAGIGEVLIAFADEHPVGAVFAFWGKAEEKEFRALRRGVPLLYHFEVPAHLRNRGIGTQLLLKAEQRLRSKGHTQVALGVDESNKDARRLYERLGYELALGNLGVPDGGTEHDRYDILVADLERTLPFDPARPRRRHRPMARAGVRVAVAGLRSLRIPAWTSVLGTFRRTTG